ncbi:Uma2 family endonuclease [Almyronema epifaneia]|uniref:Uma2 family endonuclease n=1 Tax=Almyronema epifaneia S1 TaxID=2991925 RepID=A0ABW6IKZ3_9CYAN
MTPITETLTLESFLDLPETKPAYEFVQGKIIQKPMPQGEHSRLQAKLCSAINQVAEPEKIAYAFPELRCTFGEQSIIPDIAVFRWSRIPLTLSGRIENRFFIPPDWSIEVLSPDQSQIRVLGNLLHCSQQGTELGWLLVPTEESALVVDANQRVQMLTGRAILPVIEGLELTLTVEEIYSWLTLI